MTRWKRSLAALTLSLTLAGGVAPTPVFAQDAPETGEEKSEGRPVDGYIVFAIIAFLVLFIVGKSARR
jgi:hypothetical protein